MGGAERQAFLLAKRLRNDHGAKIHFLALAHPSEPGTPTEHDPLPLLILCQDEAIPVSRLDWSWQPPGGKVSIPTRLMLQFRLARVLRELNPDALMPFITMPSEACGLSWRWSGAKTCVWNQRDEGQWLDRSLFQRLSARWTPHFISNSSEGAKALEQKLGISRDRIHHFRNIIEAPQPSLSREEARAHWNLPGEAMAVCMVANIQSRKDHATLLRAWGEVMKQKTGTHPEPWVLLLAGQPTEGEAFATVEALRSELGIEDSTRLLGQVANVPDLLQACDVAVLSSHREGVPNGVLEPMAAGLPVIATDLPGTREALGDTKFLFPSGNASCLADLLLSLLQSEASRRKASLRNIQRIEHEFDPREKATRFAELLASAVG